MRLRGFGPDACRRSVAMLSFFTEVVADSHERMDVDDAEVTLFACYLAARACALCAARWI
jgi:hypothetical protein